MAIVQDLRLAPDPFAHTIVDAHIYENHIDGLKEQLTRKPKKLPTLEIANKPLDELNFEDFKLIDYDPDPVIRFPDRKSTRLNSSHVAISYAVFCLKKKKNNKQLRQGS